MEVRRVRENDHAFIQDILENYIDNPDRKVTALANSHIEKLLGDDRTYLFAAFTDVSVIGYALAYRFPSLYAAEYVAYLYDIEVSPAHRRKGAGRLLIETVISHLRRDDVKEIWLGTGVDNKEGQGLFSATGAEKGKETFNEYTYYL